MIYHPLLDSSLDFRLILLKSAEYCRANTHIHEGSTVGIHCELQTHSLNSSPEYYAISYMWGEEYPGEKYPATAILANGDIVQVGQNLASALYQLRTEDTDVYVWADALCINQKDEVEKDTQIKRMRDIYANAAGTKVWLGGEGCRDEVMQCIYNISSVMMLTGSFPAITEAQSVLLSGGAMTKYKKLQSKADKLMDKVQETSVAKDFPFVEFGRFLELPYWNRGWIFQEVAVSSSVEFIYGSGSPRISINELRTAMAFTFSQVRIYDGERDWWPRSDRRRLRDISCNPVLQAIHGWHQSASAVVKLQREYQKMSNYGMPLLQLVSNSLFASTRSVELTDPKDRIFAFLGLANDQRLFKSVLNYSQTVEEIFRETARIMIQNGQADVLSYCQNYAGEIQNLPSWTPNWSPEILPPCNGFQWETPFTASGTGDQHQEYGKSEPYENPRHLSIQVIMVDVIEEIGNPWTPNDTPPTICTIPTFLNEVAEMCAKSDKKSRDIYLNQSDRLSAPYLIPVADRRRTTGNSASLPLNDTRKTWRKGHKLMMRLLKWVKWGIPPIRNSTVEEIWYHGTMCEMHNRRPFLSDKGYVGLGPATMERNDVIYVISGAKFPYVLRQRRDVRCGLPAYELVGEAYVHGIMYGEILSRGPRWEEITLV